MYEYFAHYSLQKKLRRNNLERIPQLRQVFYLTGISFSLWFLGALVVGFQLCLTLKLFAKNDTSERERQRNKQSENAWRCSGRVSKNWSKVLPHADSIIPFNLMCIFLFWITLASELIKQSYPSFRWTSFNHLQLLGWYWSQESYPGAFLALENCSSFDCSKDVNCTFQTNYSTPPGA